MFEFLICILFFVFCVCDFDVIGYQDVFILVVSLSLTRFIFVFAPVNGWTDAVELGKHVMPLQSWPA